MLFLTCSKLIATHVVLYIALLKTYKEGIEIWCANGFKRRCYPVLTGLMVDYEERVLIIGVKANMQCSICHVLPKKRELWPKSGNSKPTSWLRNKSNANAIIQLFSGLKLQISGCIRESFLHGTIAKSISMLFFCLIFYTSCTKTLWQIWSPELQKQLSRLVNHDYWLKNENMMDSWGWDKQARSPNLTSNSATFFHF